MKITRLLDLIIPRFMIETVVGDVKDDGELVVLCTECELRDDDIYTHKAKVRIFSFFGIAFFPKIISVEDTRKNHACTRTEQG